MGGWLHHEERIFLWYFVNFVSVLDSKVNNQSCKSYKYSQDEYGQHHVKNGIGGGKVSHFELQKWDKDGIEIADPKCIMDNAVSHPIFPYFFEQFPQTFICYKFLRAEEGDNEVYHTNEKEDEDYWWISQKRYIGAEDRVVWVGQVKWW